MRNKKSILLQKGLLVTVRTAGNQEIPNIQVDRNFWNWDYPKRRDWLNARFPGWESVSAQKTDFRSGRTPAGPKARLKTQGNKNTPAIRVVKWGKTLNRIERRKTLFGEPEGTLHGKAAVKALQCQDNSTRPGLNPRRARMWASKTEKWIRQGVKTGDHQPNQTRLPKKEAYGNYSSPTTAGNIDDRIDEWHEDKHKGPKNENLHTHLGLTWEEYKHWVETQTLPTAGKTATAQEILVTLHTDYCQATGPGSHFEVGKTITEALDSLYISKPEFRKLRIRVNPPEYRDPHTSEAGGEIVLTRRTDDYHTQIPGKTWECGRTPQEAIRSLWKSKPETKTWTILFNYAGSAHTKKGSNPPQTQDP